MSEPPRTDVPHRLVVGLAAWLVRRRRLVVLVSVVVAVASAIAASRLPLRGDFANLLPPDAPSVRQLHALEARVRVPSTFMLGIESDDAGARARAFESLKAKLRALPPELVDGIVADERVARGFVLDHRFLYAPRADLEAARDAIDAKIVGLGLDEGDAEGGLDAIERRLADARQKLEAPSEMISKDGRLQLILVRAPFDSNDGARAARLIAALDAALAAVRAEVPGATLGMTGDAITVRAENETLLQGMLLSTLATIALVLGALLLFYRTLRGVAALGWSLAVGALATFGFTELVIGHLNLASAFLSSIVIGNGINFGLLLLARWLEERHGGRRGADAIARAMAGTAKGTCAAACAAAVAYGSLAITPFRGFRDFGVIGGVGMLLCWLATYTLLPALLAFVDDVGVAARRFREPPLGRLFARLVAQRSPWPAALVGGALLCGTFAGAARFLLRDPFEDDLRNLRSNSPALERSARWMAKFDDAFGHGISGGFAIAVPRREDAAPLAAKLRAVDAGKPLQAQLFSHVHTLDDLLPTEQREKLALLGEIRTKLDRMMLPRASKDERRALLELRPPDDLRMLTDADLPEALAWPFTERDGTRGRIVLANNGLGVDSWSVKSLESFARSVRQMDLGDGVLVGGSAFVFADMLDAMERDGPRATAFSALGSLVVVLLTVGFGRYAGVTVACGALGTFGLLTVASLVGLKVNFLDFVALPITIGIGIDYAVNIASRAREHRSRIEGTSGAERGGGRYAITHSGGVVALCSYTTVVGYASLLFSANRGIRTFGLSAMIGELTCISTALLFAPAFLDALSRWKERRVPSGSSGPDAADAQRAPSARGASEAARDASRNLRARADPRVTEP
jgi:hypothetical protein